MCTELFSFWAGPIGPLEKLCLESFGRHNLELTLFTYSKISNLSESIIQKDARLFIHDDIFKRYLEKNLLTAFANRFRYKVLNSIESCWVDADVLCNEKFENAIRSEYVFGMENRHFVNNAIIKMPLSSKLASSLLIYAETLDIDILFHGQTGPIALTDWVHRLNLENQIYSIDKFYPIPYTDVWRLWDPAQLDYTMDAYQRSSSMHLWAEAMRIGKADFLKYGPPKKSFLGQQFRIAGLGNSALPELTITDIRSDLKYLPRGKRGKAILKAKKLYEQGFIKWRT